MKPLIIKTSKGITTNISRIIDIAHVINLDESILSDAYTKNGFIVDVPEVEGLTKIHEKVNLVPCPYSSMEGLIIIDEIAFAANTFLRVLEDYKNGNRTIATLSRALKSYQSIVLNRLSGKEGILNKYIIGRRISGSARAVLQTSSSFDSKLVFIPHEIARNLLIKEGDPVLIGRDPTIWEGSFECLIASIHPTDSCARLHPDIYKQLGADNDGDAIWILSINKKFHKEALEKVAKFHEKETIKFEEPNGSSVSPECILDSQNSEYFKNRVSSNIGPEAKRIASGLSSDELSKYLLTINNTMLVQKIYLGPVGAASQKLKLLASHDKILSESANYVSERAQQSLFDIKGVTNDQNSDLDNFFELLDILNMTGKYNGNGQLIPFDKIIETMESFGFDSQKSRPILAYIYTYIPVYHALISLRALDKEDKEKLSLLYKTKEKHSVISYICDKFQITSKQLTASYIEARKDLTLTKIVTDPYYNFVSSTVTKKILDALPLIGVDFNTITSRIYKTSLENHKNVQPKPTQASVDSARLHLQEV